MNNLSIIITDTTKIVLQYIVSRNGGNDARAYESIENFKTTTLKSNKDFKKQYKVAKVEALTE